MCEPCRAELPYLPHEVCARCAGLRSARGKCRGCQRLSPALGSIRAALAYEGAARSAVLSLKFRSGRCLAPQMGELLRDALALRPVTVDLIMPVPLAPARLRERGFNQAALLAAEVVASVDAELTCDGLVREPRPPQSRLSRDARRRNVRGSVSVAAGASGQIAGRSVLLVDDVVTTGATLSACADALRVAGATHVLALAFARDL